MNDLSMKVLLIEDNPGDARLIREMLKESKSIRYKLEWVDRLSLGLTQLTGDAIDIVLLDLLLPDSHGLETLEKTLSHTKDLPIVVLTGIDDEELAIHALRHGAQDYLVKGDMNSSLLGRSISYAIERKRAEVALQRAHDTLEERVKERTDAFVMQNKRLLQEIEERRRAENLYRMLADNVSDVIWTTDLDLHFNYVSPSVDRLLGYTSDEILKISISKILSPASLKTVLDLEKKFREVVECVDDKKWPAGSQTIELDLIRKDGRLIWTEATLTFIRGDGNSPDMMLGVTRDITRRKQAENERWESENRYRLLVESSPTGIFFYDTQLRLIDCNARFESFRKVTRESLIGVDLNTLTDPRVIQILRESLEGKSGVFEGLYEVMISGNEMWINLKSAPVFTIDGTIIGGVAVIEDIAERIMAKQVLEKSKAELEVKTRNLEESNTALKILLNRIEEDKTELQDNVLSNIRHLISPIIEKIKVSSSKGEIDGCVDVLEASLNNIVSPFLRNMSLKHYHLTPKEMQVANLVKEGKTTKEIAGFMNVSVRAVEVHRDNIRGKLNIKHKKANLRSMLLSMS